MVPSVTVRPLCGICRAMRIRLRPSHVFAMCFRPATTTTTTTSDELLTLSSPPNFHAHTVYENTTTNYTHIFRWKIITNNLNPITDLHRPPLPTPYPPRLPTHLLRRLSKRMVRLTSLPRRKLSSPAATSLRTTQSLHLSSLPRACARYQARCARRNLARDVSGHEPRANKAGGGTQGNG